MGYIYLQTTTYGGIFLGGGNPGAIGMKQGGNNGHNGQFSHRLVYCVDTMDAVPRNGHKEQLTLNQ